MTAVWLGCLYLMCDEVGGCNRPLKVVLTLTKVVGLA